jgi:hypothetical protein
VKFPLLFLAFCAILPAQMPTMGGGAAPPNSAAPAVDPNTVVITVGDHKITAAQFQEMVKALPPQYQETAKGPGRRDFARNLVELQVLSDEAVKQGLDKDAATEMMLQFQRLCSSVSSRRRLCRMPKSRRITTHTKPITKFSQDATS